MQKKNKLLSFAVLPLAFLFLFLWVFTLSAGAVDHFSITVKDNGQLVDNGKLIFYEKDIAPGFSGQYNIDVVNNYSETVNIYVENIKAKSTAPTTDHFLFDFNGGNYNASGKLGDFTPDSPVVLSVHGGAKAVLNLTLGLDSTAGNAYQNSTTTFTVTFRAEMTRSSSSATAPITTGDDKPATGDSTQLWLVLLLLLISTLCILIVTRLNKLHRKETPHE